MSLARGWEKQLDTRYDSALLSPRLTAAGYARWLREQAVTYVALPDAKLDPSSAREGELIRAGLPYLREVFASRHWRIYAVRSPQPLASGPGALTSLGHDSFALRASSPGRLPRARPLHALLDAHARARLCGAGARGVDGGRRARSRSAARAGQLLAVARARLGARLGSS